MEDNLDLEPEELLSRINKLPARLKAISSQIAEISLTMKKEPSFENGELLLKLTKELEDAQKSFYEAITQYNLYLTESLNKRIEKLNTITNTMATTAEKQLTATTELKKSSKTLEILTGALMILTAAIIVFNGYSFFVQTFTLQGYNPAAALKLSFYNIIIIIAVLGASMFILATGTKQLNKPKTDA